MELSHQMTNSLIVIQWTLILMAVSLWGVMIYSFCARSLRLQRLKRRQRAARARRLGKREPFTLEQMRKDLDGSTRPKTDCPESEWD